MRMRASLKTAALALLALASSLWARPPYVSPELLARGATDAPVRFIVRLKAHGLPAAPGGDLVAARVEESHRAADDLVQALGGREGIGPWGDRRVSSVRPLWIANALAIEGDAALVEELAQRPDVEAIIPDAHVRCLPPRELAVARSAIRPLATPPGDWALSAIKADLAHQAGLDGSGVTVGHIDTGVDSTHPALAGKIVAFKDFVNHRTGNAYDDEGHGTHTAGSIAASLPGHGVAPGAHLIVAKALDSKGEGDLSALIDAMQWMLAPGAAAAGSRPGAGGAAAGGEPGAGAPAPTVDRPLIVSGSWGVNVKDLGAAGYDNVIFWDAVQAMHDGGIVPIFAVGNDGPGTELVPGAYPIVVSVGAFDVKNTVSSFGSGGVFPFHDVSFMRPDVSGPGVDIESTAPGGGLQIMSGTSMATPHAAGVAALIKQANPKLGARDIERLMIETAVRLSPSQKMRDERTGEGRLDAMAAIEAARRLQGPMVQPPDGFIANRADVRNNPGYAPVHHPGMSPVAAFFLTSALALVVAMFFYFRV